MLQISALWDTAVWDAAAWSSTFMLRGPTNRNIYRFAETVQFKVRGDAGKAFSLINAVLRYTVGAEVRVA